MTLPCGCQPGTGHMVDAEARDRAASLGVAGADRVGLFCPVRGKFYRTDARAWTFRVDGVPGTKGRPRFGLGQARPEGRTVRYEQLVAGAAAVAGVRWAPDRAFSIHVRIWTPDRRVKDGDNVVKVILDGLQKAGAACLPDDGLACVPRGSWEGMGVDRRRCGVEITIRQIEAVP